MFKTEMTTEVRDEEKQQQQQYLPSEIVSFYKHKTIFITGATGFLGKVLIEKLLRTCYDLDKIYVLIRSKKGHSASHRLNELLNCPVLTVLFFICLTSCFSLFHSNE